MADAPETSSAAVSPVAEDGSADAAKKQSWALPRELPKLPGLPEMPELPELPKLPKLEMPTPPSTVLAQQLAKDWGWLLQLELPFFDDGQLHTFVSTKRRTVSSVMESIDSSIQRASSTLEWMQEPSPLIGRWWARTLEWRRKSPALVVAAITAASVAPGIHHPATYTPPTQLISEPTLIYTLPTPRHRTPISSYRLPRLCHWRYPELRALLP